MPKLLTKQTAKYSVIVGLVQRAKPEYWPGCHFSVSLQKNFGDSNSMSTCVPSKEDILRLFKMMKKAWEGYDNILDRKGDPVKPENLYFEDTTGTMMKLELFGNTRLF